MTTIARPAKSTVAVVDDSPLALEMTRRALENGGFAVVTACNIAELEAAISRSAPDLLLVDVNMPEMYGDHVAMVLKQVRRFDVPIWLFSNELEADLASRVKDAKADGFISKNDGMEAVVARVQAILRRDS
jgi:two-component system, OmpR family, KDP operon response regulator KdpE